MAATEESQKTKRQRERRAEKRKLGHCRDCSAKKVAHGGRCDSCWKKFKIAFRPIWNRWKAKQIMKGCCSQCLRRKTTGGFKTCRTCRAKGRAHDALRKRRR